MEMEFFVKPGTDEDWHQYWIDQRSRLVHRPRHPRKDNLRLLRAPQGEASPLREADGQHWFRFNFIGSEWGELEGVANRTDFDLTTHQAASKVDLTYLDQESGERYIP